MLMAPVKYHITQIPDFPMDEGPHVLGQLFPSWPQWSPQEEEELQVSAHELATLQDPVYGHDLRLLRQESICPCFLHSYGNVLMKCPCGCRQGPFSEARLLRDGVRGFYIISMITGEERWLHPREAALLCGLDPQMILPQDLRSGLCLVGQCASPLQAAWIGAHLIDMTQGTTGTPRSTHALYKMWLLRQAHGMIPKKADVPVAIRDDKENTCINIRMSNITKAKDLLQAEERLQGRGVIRVL